MMTGSPLLGWWIAQLAFWAFLALGAYAGELHGRTVIVFVLLWLVGYMGLPLVGVVGEFLVTPYVAVLDVALAFFVFKGDVRLT